MSLTVGSGWSPEEILQVSRCQKFLIWLILLQIVSIFLIFGTLGAAAGGATGPAAQTVAGVVGLVIMVARIIISVLSIYGVYKMAQSLRKGGAVFYGLAMLIPLIGLVLLLVLNQEATRLLQANGVRVGLMGANQEDLQQIRSTVGVTP